MRLALSYAAVKFGWKVMPTGAAGVAGKALGAVAVTNLAVGMLAGSARYLGLDPHKVRCSDRSR